MLVFFLSTQERDSLTWMCFVSTFQRYKWPGSHEDDSFNWNKLMKCSKYGIKSLQNRIPRSINSLLSWKAFLVKNDLFSALINNSLHKWEFSCISSIVNISTHNYTHLIPPHLGSDCVVRGDSDITGFLRWQEEGGLSWFGVKMSYCKQQSQGTKSSVTSLKRSCIFSNDGRLE